MNKQFESLVDTQKEVLDFWNKASKNVMESFNKAAGKSNSKELNLEEWYKKQQKLLADAMKITNPKEAMEKGPQQFKNWLDLQSQFAKQYIAFYSDHSSSNSWPSNAFTPKFWNQNSNNPMNQWTKGMDYNTKWIRENLLSKIPFSMHMHFDNFTESYEELGKYWESFQKMIQFGLFDQSTIQQFFPAAAFQEFMGKFMGFKPMNNVDEWLKQMNQYFDQYTEFFENAPQQMAEHFQNLDWKQYIENLGRSGGNPFLQATLDINQMVQDSMASLYHVSGHGKEVEIAKLVKDIQFSFVAFVIKSVDLQNKVYQAGQFALPDTLSSFYTDYKETKEMPDYPTFFNTMVGRMEHYMIEVLESDHYSQLQSEVAQLGVTIKAQIDKMVEIVFGDSPFLMKSHADEVAKELTSLKRKIRSLEQKLAHLDIQDAPVVKANANPSEADALFGKIGSAQADQKDDLKKIKGIGPKLENMLNSIGIFTYAQLSKMTEKEYDILDTLLTSFQGRAKRDNWALQAKSLLN